MGDSFNVDDVYIIGAIVDKAKEDHLTFAKARKEKIRMVRFPLDNNVRYVRCNSLEVRTDILVW